MHNALYKMIKHRTLKTHIILNGFRHVSTIKMHLFFSSFFRVVRAQIVTKWSIDGLWFTELYTRFKATIKIKNILRCECVRYAWIEDRVVENFHRPQTPFVDSLYCSLQSIYFYYYEAHSIRSDTTRLDSVITRNKRNYYLLQIIISHFFFVHHHFTPINGTSYIFK